MNKYPKAKERTRLNTPLVSRIILSLVEILEADEFAELEDLVVVALVELDVPTLEPALYEVEVDEDELLLSSELVLLELVLLELVLLELVLLLVPIMILV